MKKFKMRHVGALIVLNAVAAGMVMEPSAGAQTYCLAKKQAAAFCNYDPGGFLPNGAAALWNNTGTTQSAYCGLIQGGDPLINGVTVYGTNGIDCTLRLMHPNLNGVVYHPDNIDVHSSWDEVFFGADHAVVSSDGWAVQCAVLSTGLKHLGSIFTCWGAA